MDEDNKQDLQSSLDLPDMHFESLNNQDPEPTFYFSYDHGDRPLNFDSPVLPDISSSLNNTPEWLSSESYLLPDLLEEPEVDLLPNLISSGDMIGDLFVDRPSATYPSPTGDIQPDPFMSHLNMAPMLP